MRWGKGRVHRGTGRRGGFAYSINQNTPNWVIGGGRKCAEDCTSSKKKQDSSRKVEIKRYPWVNAKTCSEAKSKVGGLVDRGGTE